MTTITAGMVAELRARTDAPMMECKKALTEAAGDLDKAEEILRVKLGNKASKAAARVTAEGAIFTATVNGVTSLLELNCETDFVAKNDDFIAFGQASASLVASHNPSDVQALSNFALNEGTVETTRVALIGKIGENVSIRRFMRVAQNQQVVYLHGSRIGVLVEYTGAEQPAKDAAMQVAAMKPLSLDASGIAPEVLDRERSVALLKAQEAGKPEAVAQKMVEGSVQKFLKEVTLLSQAFVKNDKQTVAEMLAANQTTVYGFTMFVVGEGIEKKQNDFAAEVAAQVAAAQNA